MAEPSLEDNIAQLRHLVDMGQLQLQRDIFNQISLPTSYGSLTGFLPGSYPGYGGLGTWDTLMGTANLFGQTGNDPRWAQLGYGPNMPTMAGMAMQQSDAARDANMSMQYGGTFVAGAKAPDWMAPHAAWAREFARTHQGRQPSQQELTQGVSEAVNGALAQLRTDPGYQQADQAQRMQLEGSAVASATGIDPQNAGMMVRELRSTGRTATPDEIVNAIGRWNDPDPRVSAINRGMQQLREDPAYQQLDGAGRVQREAQVVGQITGLPPDQAQAFVTDLRQGKGTASTLTGNSAVRGALDRFSLGNPAYGRNQPMYGQPGGPAQAQPGQAQLAGGGQRQTYAFDAPDSMFPGGGGGGGGFDPNGRFNLGGVNYGGGGNSYPGMDYTAAMSPEQRRLYEAGRQFDVSAQIQVRGQDLQNAIAWNQQRVQEALAAGNLGLARQHEANITELQQQQNDLAAAGVTGTFQGQETLAARQQRQQNENARMQMLANLRSPEDIVQYARVSGGLGGGLEQIGDAATGRFQVAPGEGAGGATNPATLQGLGNDVGGVGPTGFLTNQGGQQPVAAWRMNQPYQQPTPYIDGQPRPQGPDFVYPNQINENVLYRQGYGPQQNEGLRARQWGETREGEAYMQVEGPGNPSWEARHPEARPADQQPMTDDQREQMRRTLQTGQLPPGAQLQREPYYSMNQQYGQGAAQQDYDQPGQGAAMADYRARSVQGGGLNPPVRRPGQAGSNQTVFGAMRGLASPDQWNWQNVERLSPTNQKMLYALSEGQGRRVEDIQAEHERTLGRYQGARAGRQAANSF